MTILSIPNTGYKVGTCGWLAKGLQDGSIKIQPGTSKSGKGGLWLYADGKQDCLAIFNEFDMSDFGLSGQQKFMVVCQEFCSRFPLTRAAEEYLISAAQEWCDQANELRENDRCKMPKIAIVNA